MEEKKNLVEEYLAKTREDAIYFKDYPNMPLYREDEIKMAFNAGRESVVENMPELKWREIGYIKKEFYAECPFGGCYIIEFVGLEFEVCFNFQFVARSSSFSHAKKAANEDYKKRMRQMLGL